MPTYKHRQRSNELSIITMIPQPGTFTYQPRRRANKCGNWACIQPPTGGGLLMATNGAAVHLNSDTPHVSIQTAPFGRSLEDRYLVCNEASTSPLNLRLLYKCTPHFMWVFPLFPGCFYGLSAERRAPPRRCIVALVNSSLRGKRSPGGISPRFCFILHSLPSKLPYLLREANRGPHDRTSSKGRLAQRTANEQKAPGKV